MHWDLICHEYGMMTQGDTGFLCIHELISRLEKMIYRFNP